MSRTAAPAGPARFRSPVAPVHVPREALARGAEQLGVALTPEQLDRFDAYAAALRAGKQAFNLTALTDPLDVAIKHFLDSLTVLSVLPPESVWLIDVGTGAGFPGLALKIARPALQVTLLEATAKKAAWLRQTAEALDLTGVAVIAARAEELAHDPAHRGRYDVATARALAPLPVLYELCLPFLRVGGTLIAQKTTTGVELEVPQGARALEILGGRLREVRLVAVDPLPNRVLVVVEQERPAPSAYPRRPGVPAKKPLQ